MKRTLSLLSLLIMYATACLGQEGEQKEELFRSLIPGDHYDLGRVSFKKQEIADFFGVKIFREKDMESYTRITSFIRWRDEQGDNEEIIYHIGWYADGYIITQINGGKKGYQTVIMNNEIIGISYPSEHENESGDERVINQYSWGRVTTRPDEQSIERYLSP